MSLTNFGVSDFMAKIDGLGSYAKADKFTIQIIPPELTKRQGSIDPATIEFLAKKVSFPARSFGTTTYRSAGMFSLEVPYETTFEPVSISFMGTNNYEVRKFWLDWFEFIQRTGDTASGSVGRYNMKYYKQFKGTVTITSYGPEENMKETHKIKLHDCWPKTISAIELGWDQTDPLEFDVDLVYSRWTAETI
tara:strand:- start:1132 stop:1707 length:576 start_codon:yes stop_codon:yes gene_type:complete